MIETIIHVDMDNTICKYESAFIDCKNKNPLIEYPQSAKGFFLNLEPIDGAIESVKLLEQNFKVYITTRPSYLNPDCYTEKRLWVEKYFGLETCRNLTMAPDKGLLYGDFLVDDLDWFSFKGKQLKFGSEEFPNWNSVINYFDHNVKRIK